VFEQLENMDEVTAMLLVLLWGIAGYRVGRLVFRPSRQKLRKSARRSLRFIWFCALAVAGRLAVAGYMTSYGWDYGSNRMILAVPLLVLPFAATLALSVPALRAIAAAEPGNPDAPTTPGQRSAAAAPRLVIPVQTTAIGALLGLYVVFVARPVPPYTRYLIGLWGVLAVGTAVLSVRQRMRQAAQGAVAARRPRLWARMVRFVGTVAAVALGLSGTLSYAQSASRLPGKLAMDSSPMDWGGGPKAMAGMAMDHSGKSVRTTTVTNLTGDISGTPDESFTLTAQDSTIRLASGKTIHGMAFNGQTPGPELRVHEGDLVQVKLVNHLAGRRAGVTLHWHGLDVPNAEDGVAGVTQNAVQPGHTFTYRFRPHQVGTFWYHSHQDSFEEVTHGLYGALVVLPRSGRPQGLDMTVLAHLWPTANGVRTAALGTSDRLQRRTVAPGTRVRLRLVNTSSLESGETEPTSFTLTGAPFTVSAIDGTDLNKPTPLRRVRLLIGEGARDDLTFTMPDHPVRLSDLQGSFSDLVLRPGGTGDGTRGSMNWPAFDPAAYGSPAPTPFGPHSHFDRKFKLIIDDRPGYYDGKFYFLPTINGKSFPHIPMLMVRKGDLVEQTFVNRGHAGHPMHLHGHHALVLAHNGNPVTGSPWWTDTLYIQPGESYQIAFLADNPGIWMDHCHNLEHATMGMVMHLAYEGVSSPFEVGRDTGNKPE
jgi:FtsP/CotA-like multicopper oxidase with cupredoxin domain